MNKISTNTWSEAECYISPIKRTPSSVASAEWLTQRPTDSATAAEDPSSLRPVRSAAQLAPKTRSSVVHAVENSPRLSHNWDRPQLSSLTSYVTLFHYLIAQQSRMASVSMRLRCLKNFKIVSYIHVITMWRPSHLCGQISAEPVSLNFSSMTLSLSS